MYIRSCTHLVALIILLRGCVSCLMHFRVLFITYTHLIRICLFLYLPLAHSSHTIDIAYVRVHLAFAIYETKRSGYVDSDAITMAWVQFAFMPISALHFAPTRCWCVHMWLCVCVCIRQQSESFLVLHHHLICCHPEAPASHRWMHLYTIFSFGFFCSLLSSTLFPSSLFS